MSVAKSFRGAALPTQSCQVAKPAARMSVRASAQQDSALSRRGLIASILATATVATAGNAYAAETFLSSTGVRNVFQQEEEELFRLRQAQEGQARAKLLEQIERLEKEAKDSQNGKLCATPFGVDVVGITELIALVGATTAGIAARQRKVEVERLNEQLRKINLSLRQQARAGTVYAPGLTYAPSFADNATLPTLPKASPPAIPAVAPAPVASPSSNGSSNGKPSATVVAGTSTSKPSTTMLSMDEDDMNTDQIACRDALRAGKRLLKEQNGAAAMVRFEKALMLSKAMQDKVQERRATRGLAASARLLGQHKMAIKHLERVLMISADMNEFTGDADAYGTIADCYTDLGNFEKAAAMYDKYIELMNSDVPAKL